MNRTEPTRALRSSRDCGVGGFAWIRSALCCAAIVAGSSRGSAGEPAEFPYLESESRATNGAADQQKLSARFSLATLGGPDDPERVAARAKQNAAKRRADKVPSSGIDAAPAQAAERKPKSPWIRLLSAVQIHEVPTLVPLPEPPLPTIEPPAPIRPQKPLFRDEGSGPVSVEPLVPPLVPPVEAGCPKCTAAASAPALPMSPSGIGIASSGPAISAPRDRFGMGSRQVPFAIFHIDPVEPLSQIRLRADFRNGLETPDRAERFWAAPPVGPKTPERDVDVQIFSVYSETGGDHFSVFTEVPLVSMQTEMNGDTSGLGNLVVGQKFLLTNPKNNHWQIAQVMRTYLPTGAAQRGLGNGLIGLEPGLLLRYRLNDQTYFHGEVKYLIPLGGDPLFAGQVTQYGVGASRVLWQTDDRAILATMEAIGTTIGGGRATLLDGSTRAVNGDTFVSLLPGVRATLGPSGDLGLFEVGVSGGVTVGDPGWYDSRVLVDFRWSF